MNPEIQSLCNEVIGALLTGGAQGVAIVGLVWAFLKVTRRANAATRHAVWFATLLIVASLPVATFMAAHDWKKAEPALNAPDATAANLADMEPLAISDISFAEQWTESPAPAAAIPTVGIKSAQPEPAISWKLAVPRNIALVLVLGWFALALVRLAGLAWQLRILRRIKAEAAPAPGNLLKKLEAVRCEMGIRRGARLMISEEIPAPMVVGFFRPAMLLPQSVCAISSPAQLDYVFRHELAHAARWDDWANLLQQLIAAVLFFHPGILFLSRRLTAEREIACDDHALAAIAAPREYALFLTEFAGRMKGRDFSAAPAAWSSNSQLKERIGMILDGKRNASPRASRGRVGLIAGMSLTLALAALASTPRLIVAAEEPEVAEEKTVETSVELTVTPETPSISVASVVSASAPVAPVAPVVAVAPVTVTAPREKRGQIGQPSSSAQPAQPAQPGASAWAGAPRAPMVVAAGHPEPPDHPGPRPVPAPRFNRGDNDIERRLDRLERMVESLLDRDRGEGRGKEAHASNRGNQNMDFNFNRDMERVHREVEKAHREVERTMRDIDIPRIQKEAAEAARQAADVARNNKMAGRESLKAHRDALEMQRKQIEKQIQALEKQMDKERDTESKDSEKKEKIEKKRRDTSDKPSPDDSDFKPK